MKYICPILVVQDLKKSRYLYETLLEQTVLTDFGENITFKGSFALHEHNHFNQLTGVKANFEPANHFELYFETDHPDTAYQKLKEAGLKEIHPPREQPWRQIVMRFYDYDHHILEIGESMEHTAYRLSCENLSIAEIAGTLYLSEEKTVKAIEKFKKGTIK